MVQEVTTEIRKGGGGYSQRTVPLAPPFGEGFSRVVQKLWEEGCLEPTTLTAARGDSYMDAGAVGLGDAPVARLVELARPAREGEDAEARRAALQRGVEDHVQVRIRPALLLLQKQKERQGRD